MIKSLGYLLIFIKVYYEYQSENKDLIQLTLGKKKRNQENDLVREAFKNYLFTGWGERYLNMWLKVVIRLGGILIILGYIILWERNSFFYRRTKWPVKFLCQFLLFCSGFNFMPNINEELS